MDNCLIEFDKALSLFDGGKTYNDFTNKEKHDYIKAFIDDDYSLDDIKEGLEYLIGDLVWEYEQEIENLYYSILSESEV